MLPHNSDVRAALQGGKGLAILERGGCGPHHAVYQFTDMTKLDVAMKDDATKVLVADFDKTWLTAVTRAGDYLTLVEGRSG